MACGAVSVGEGEGEGVVEWGGGAARPVGRWSGAGRRGGGAGVREPAAGAVKGGGAAAAGGRRWPRQGGPTCRRLRERGEGGRRHGGPVGPKQ
jgi:hypothetical protein